MTDEVKGGGMKYRIYFGGWGIMQTLVGWGGNINVMRGLGDVIIPLPTQIILLLTSRGWGDTIYIRYKPPPPPIYYTYI